MSGTSRRAAIVAAAGGSLLFLVSSLVVRGGLLDSAPYGDVHVYGHYANLMASGQWPYGDFYDEYPPFAQPLFLLAHALPGSYASAFKATMVICGIAALALLVAALASVGASRRRLAVAVAATGIAPLVIGPIALNAYDFWPALLVSAALLAWVRRHERWAYVLLALAVAAKTYPLVLVPLLLVETWERGGRDLVRRGVAWFVGALVVVHLPFLVMGAGGLRFSYWSQLKRGLEVESLGGALFLALDRIGLHHVTLRAEPPGSTNVAGGLAGAIASLLSLLVVAAVLLVAWIYFRRRAEPLVAAAASVVGFVAFGKVFSPQYVDWLVPLVPAAGAAASAALLAVLGLGHVIFDRFHAPGGPDGAHYKAALAWWVVARDLVVLGLYVLLVARLRRRPSTRTT